MRAGKLHSSDDRDRNSSSDETILDGGRARVIFQETQDKFTHVGGSRSRAGRSLDLPPGSSRRCPPECKLPDLRIDET